jgi:malonyl-CoA O-methyltransferase
MRCTTRLKKIDVTLGAWNQIDKKSARAAFNRAAPSYDSHAAIQRQVSDHLLEGLDVINIRPERILDLGAATGYNAGKLAERFTRAHHLLLDSSTAMLSRARAKAPRWRSKRRYICAEIDALPLSSESVDLIVSSLAFQWSNDLDRVFAECRRVIRPNGLLIFSSPGPDTLYELREAWRSVDDVPRINQFIDMHDVGDALIRAGFASPVLECDRLTATYADVFAVMRDLRGIGAVNSLSGRKRGLSTARSVERMAAAYETYRSAGRLPATYEVVYAHAWCPNASDRRQDGSTVATFPFADLKRRP